MKKQLKHLLLVLTVLMLTAWLAAPLDAAIPDNERKALISIYMASNGDSWTAADNWKGINDEDDGFSEIGSEGTWFGITVENDHVTQIVLPKNNLDGYITARIKYLHNLEKLDLRFNELTGEIPVEIKEPTTLGYLHLGANKLEGEIPVELTELLNLEYLNLANNQLTGSIPVEIGLMTELQYLHLGTNQLTGYMPQELGSLLKLEYLNLGTNQLNGSITKMLGYLVELKYLNLERNQFNGALTTRLGYLVNLETLKLAFNTLTGEIPSELGNLINLKKLDLSSNKFSGQIPASLNQLVDLLPAYTDISYNMLEADDPATAAFWDEKDPGWSDTQTIPPKDVTAVATTYTSVLVSWTPIRYQDDDGSYHVFYGTQQGGPYEHVGDVEDKSSSSFEVTSLTPGTTYYFVVRSRTLPHAYNFNTLTSGYSAEASANTGSPITYYTLGVQTTPDNGANIAVSPADHNGEGDGVSDFSRSYAEGTVVTVTAPAQFNGRVFEKWTVNGVDNVSQSIQVTMATDVSVVASYVLPNFTLSVHTSPEAGVAVDVSPADANGNGSGLSDFSRTYVSGTLVTLTAPATFNGMEFVRWNIDGVDTPQPSIQVNMDGDHAVSAYYQLPVYTLSVQTQPTSGLTINVSPVDNSGSGGGVSDFTRLYNSGTVVTLTAPDVDGRQFLNWTVDGATVSTASIQVTMDGNHTVSANYGTLTYTLTVETSPDTGASIVASPVDNSGQGAGNSNFTRTYSAGTTVTLTAPENFNDGIFLKWVVDGVDYNSTTVNFAMNADSFATAHYGNAYYTLDVQSSPVTGVAIGVSPNDTANRGGGDTNFSRFYETGSEVTLTAAESHNDRVFSHWSIGDTDVPYSAATTVTFIMDGGKSFTANYVIPTQTLTVQSSPDTGVAITVEPVDTTGAGNGTTTFTRVYTTGTAVNLMAPEAFNNRPFSHWLINGTTYTEIQTQLTMDADYTAVAVFEEPEYGLTIQSTPNAGVAIGVSPADKNSREGGNTEFTRQYDNGVVVTLTAPEQSGDLVFTGWNIGGTVTPDLSVQLTMSGHITAIAQYDIAVYSLIVRSLPEAGAVVEVSPADNNGASNGATEFTRQYNSGVDVTLTAPAQFNNREFQTWTIDGVENTNAAIQVTMNGNHTVVAHYELPDYTLTVQSLPEAGVAITVSPADGNGAGNGNTSFTREYQSGSVVTLTAPANFNSRQFQIWTIDGVENTNATVQVTMGENHTAVAHYELPTYTLTVQSSPAAGVAITVSPADLNSNGNGNTNFTRQYAGGTSVTLTAPTQFNGQAFTGWMIDGVQNANASVTVAMTADITAAAQYAAYTLTVQSTPATGALIRVSPNDNADVGNGNCNFTRQYNVGTVVTLIAPPEFDNRIFSSWSIDGVENANTEVTVTMDGDHTAIAQYTEPEYTLSVSTLPETGATVTVSPADSNGSGTGVTNFTRVYTRGTTVTLTAPDTMDDHNFYAWNIDGVSTYEATVQVHMNQDVNAVAHYEYPTYELTVQSTPETGIDIAVSQYDTSLLRDGTTEFTRTYNNGANVTLTAPASFNDVPFAYWLVDGTQYPEVAVAVRMTEDQTAVAHYEDIVPSTYILTVQSSPDSGVGMRISPEDINGSGNGTTELTREYDPGTGITIQAPYQHNDMAFSHWTVDGVEYFDSPLALTMDADHIVIAYFGGEAPGIAVERMQVNFGAEVAGATTEDQPLTITNSGDGTLDWAVDSDKKWIKISPASGSGTQEVSVSIDSSALPAGTHSGTITITANEEMTRQVTVNTKVFPKGEKSLPFGKLLSPATGVNVSRNVPITGWALDEIGEVDVRIYCTVSNSSERVYLGDAVFLSGSRPDIEAAYPDLPKNFRSGWGYMLLTDLLPGGGNGQYLISAVAVDASGNESQLGSADIYCNNSQSELPFGAIESPAPGSEISGDEYVNLGWVLAAEAGSIPEDGSTIKGWVDGMPLEGHPVYNIYKESVAQMFPAYYNSGGAAAYYVLDTTRYANGTHVITWSVEDSEGNRSDVGSQYFTVSNRGNRARINSGGLPVKACDDCFTPVWFKRGYAPDSSPELLQADAEGAVTIQITEDQRFMLALNSRVAEENEGKTFKYSGYLLHDGQYRVLPVGSYLDVETGAFYWQPGAGFFGEYTFVFIEKEGKERHKKTVKVVINGKF
ncbi:MAG: hypothetical protein GY765_00460 [bacterium]|nr:hypothetical protein [bacterium]